jgi:hypothetical protein
VIGGKEKGLRDGSLQEALFNSPQGVASHGHELFVADTENHALRKVTSHKVSLNHAVISCS